MKRALCLSLAAVFLVPLFSSAAYFSNTAPDPPAPADPVQSIRQHYTAINKRLPKCRKVKKELSGFSLEGGGLVAYFDGLKIVKIVANHYGESGQALEQYYYRNESLIFVFRKDQSYDKPMSGKVVRTEENRFYFENGQLIRWINEAGKQVAPGTEEYRQRQDEYLDSSSKFLEGARSKKATIEAE